MSSMSSLSIEAKPIVKPDMNPAVKVNRSEIPMYV
jgi:hypothetical protein